MYVKIKAFFVLIVLLNISESYAFEMPKVHGFGEFSFGARWKDDTTRHENYNLFEQRLQLKSYYYPTGSLLANFNTEFNFKADLLVDEYANSNTGFELREINVLFSPISRMDVKTGRQIFTWGTGDYLFINDLFPKDYVSFYIGRDDEYLKKSSDGVRVSLYNKHVNANVIITSFEPNTMPDGYRLSFFDSFQGGISGIESDLSLIEPLSKLRNTEIALRLYRNFQSYETALYFFRGFYKIPKGYANESLHQLFYPRLNVYGMSLRGPALRGIANVEAGLYDSREDKKGADRLIENSAFKIMAGYEKDLGRDLRVSGQYLYERLLDYRNYKEALVAGDYFWDEHRHLFTLRISKLLMSQTLKLSLFTFYSPSDEDIYLRPLLEYNVTDYWKLVLGANLIRGKEAHTEFGQMEKNSNIYVRIRYSF